MKVPTEKLEFDRHNPRLVSEIDLLNATEEQIIAELVQQADIPELVDSIVSNTYLDIEPLIVTEKDAEKEGNFRVLEGNRRLCAIRLIADRELATRCKVSIPEDVPDAVIESLKEVTVFSVNDEKDSRAFIGFKHINGPHRWDSYAKGKYLAEWYLEEKENGLTIEQIALQLGDGHQTVRNLVSAMLVLQQAESEKIFRVSDRTKPGKFGFSHLYTALSRNEYLEFLNLERDWNKNPNSNPIARENLGNLEIMLNYIYGSIEKGIDSVVKSQNPDLKRLGEALIKPRAMATLQSTNSLVAAYDEVLPESTVFKESLIIASQKVKETLTKVSKFDVRDADILLEEADFMLENADNIMTLMRKKIDKASNSGKDSVEE